MTEPSRRSKTSEDSLPKTQAEIFTRAGEKVRSNFPDTPGVYLFQDQAGRVIYIGKAKNLRARVGSYFLKAAADEQRTTRLVREVYDVDYLDAENKSAVQYLSDNEEQIPIKFLEPLLLRIESTHTISSPASLLSNNSPQSMPGDTRKEF